MTRDQLTNRAILNRLRQLGGRLLLYASFHNVYCVMLVGIGVGMLLRPEQSALMRLAAYAHTQISIELYALLFVAFGAWGLNRPMTVGARIWLTFPFLIHTGSTWLLVVLLTDAALAPAVVYTAVCFWLIKE